MQQAVGDAQLRFKWPVRMTLLRTGQWFRSHVHDKKMVNNQWLLKPTKSMRVALSKAYKEKPCGPLCWTKKLPTTCDDERWKIEDVVYDA